VPKRRDVVDQLRAICAALPEVEERLSHGTPTFFVRGKKSFLMVWPQGHHGVDHPQLWCAAPPGAQEELLTTEPERFFRPPYVGPRGWVGLRLDVDVDGDELAALCADAFRTVAPKTLIARLDDQA
jgi:hypothetical protein